MNEIVKSNNVIQSMEDVERAARAMSASKFFPDSKDAAQAIVKILAGRELGFGAFASMAGVAVIQGKPVVGANLTAAAIKQTGKYNYRVTQHTDQICEIEFFEQGQSVGKSSFSMEDAKAAGLTTKDNWKKYPRNMLFARAISNGQKWYAPDVYNGVTVYTPDEMGAIVDEEGNAVEILPEITDKLWDHFIAVCDKASKMGMAIRMLDRSKVTKDELIAYGVELNDAITQYESQNKEGA